MDRPAKSIVVAVAENGCIGKDNKLPWHFPSDLAWFKQLTWHGIVVMGRRTFESIGRPLPHRHNIVVTRCKYPEYPQVQTVESMDACWNELKKVELPVFVIGGRMIFEQALQVVECIYLTKVPGKYDGDVFFPRWPLESFGWSPVEQIDRPNEDGLEFWSYRK